MDIRSIKPRLPNWVRRSDSQESFQSMDAENQVRAFLASGSSNTSCGQGSEHPPAYSPRGTLMRNQAQPIRELGLGNQPGLSYQALPPPLRSVSQPPTTGSTIIAPQPLWNEQRPSTTSPLQQWEETSSASHVAINSKLQDRLGAIFQPYVETIKPVDEITLDEWLRAAVWWAIRGRASLARTQYVDDSYLACSEDGANSKTIFQGLTDMGKAWWICHEVIAQDNFKVMTSDLRIKSTPRGALLDQYRCVVRYLRPYSHQLETTLLGRVDPAAMIDIDRCLWVFYAPVAPYDVTILDDQRLAAWSIPLAFGDTDDLFCYSSELVQVTLFSQEEYSLTHSFPCVLSIVRTRSSWETLGVIASQTQLIHVTVQSNRKQGPTWKDIEWDVGRLSMLVKLHRGFFLDVKFTEDSFKHIWEAVHDIVLTEGVMVAGPDEEIIFDDTIKACHYINHDKPIDFPARPTAECRVRLLKESTTVTAGPNKRRSHRGYRVFISTPPQMKEMHQVSHFLNNSSPVVYSLLDAEDGSPGIFLHVFDDGQKRSIFLYFHHPESRTLLHSLLVDLIPGPGEVALQTFPISSFVMLERQTREPGSQGARHLEFGESLASVIEQAEEPETTTNPYGKTTLSENLRIVVETDWGSMTDRLNIGPGELAIGLSVLDNTILHLHRLPQEDLTMTVAQGLASGDLQMRVSNVLDALQNKPTIRRVKFETLPDLHRFQEAITGFKVIFDTVATRFYITRRRKLISSLKHWDANITRVQVVQRGTKMQILAFFHQFRLWKCINFGVKVMDEFERVDQKGEWGVRIKDAKYTAPLTDPADSRYGFVCLDEMEYPTEHDDMVVMFGQLTVREQFVTCLPGIVGDAPKGLLCW